MSISANTTGNALALTNGAVEYTSLVATAQNPNTTVTNGVATVNCDGTLGPITVTLTAAPNNGAGTQSFAFTVMKTNGTVATTNSCTISEGATTCTSSNSVALVAGDTVNVRITTTGTPVTSQISALTATYGSNAIQ